MAKTGLCEIARETGGERVEIVQILCQSVGLRSCLLEACCVSAL